MAIYDETDFEKKFKRLQESEDVIPQNKKDILEFLKFMKIMNRGTHRRIRYLQNLTTLSRLLGKPFRSMTREDAEELIAKIQKQKTREGTAWTPSTQMNLKIELKRFMAWLRKCDRKQYPKEVSWIELGGDCKRKLDREQLLEDEDVAKLVNATSKASLKAMIALEYQTGLRPTELLDLKVKDWICENGVYSVRVNGTKTAAAVREIPVIDLQTIKLVNEWLEEHPKRKTLEFKESALWISSLGKPLEYSSFRNFLSDLFKRAEVNKPGFPYVFRHSRLNTWYNDARIPQQQSNYLAGHSQTSRAMATYHHPIKQDAFNTFAKIAGSAQDVLEQQVEELALEMEDETTKKSPEYGKAKLEAWKKYSATKFKRWDALIEQLVKHALLKTRGQKFRKRAHK